MGLHFTMMPWTCNTQRAYKRNFIYLLVFVSILVLKSRQPLMARLATADRCSLPSNKVMITNNDATESRAWQRKGHGPGGHVTEERWRCDGRPATVQLFMKKPQWSIRVGQHAIKLASSYRWDHVHCCPQRETAAHDHPLLLWLLSVRVL